MTAARGPAEGPNEAGSSPAARFARIGLELIDLPAGDDELAVIEAVDGLYRPLIDALLEAELDGIPPEPGPDMSAPPT
jgi:hypothetical protein